MVKNVEQNIEGMTEKELGGSPEQGQLKSIVVKLQSAATDQTQVNTLMSDAGLSSVVMGAALVLPGIGIVFSPGSQMFEKFASEGEPLSMSEFESAFEKFAGALGEMKEAATEAYNKLVSKLRENANYIEERCRMAISREKNTIKNNREGKKESGWFGSFSRFVTLSDPYKIEIDKARQKVSNLTSHARTRIREAQAMLASLPSSVEGIDPGNPPDFAKMRDLMDTCNRLVSTNSRVDTDNSHWTQEQEALDVSERVAFTAIEAFAMVATMGGSAAVSGGTKAARVVGQGIKYGYKAYSASYKVAIGAAVVTGVVAEQYREEESEENSEESEESGFAKQVIDLISADPEERNEMISAKFMDAIPNGEGYVYSQELSDVATDHIKGIGADLLAYRTAESPEEQEEIITRVTKRIDAASGDVMHQFLKDNLEEGAYTDYETAQSERKLNDPYHIQALAGSMRVMERVAKGDIAGATQVAETYVRDKLLGLNTENSIDPETRKMVSDMAANMVNIIALQTYPLFVAGLQKYSKTGFTKSFMNRANLMKDFIGDAVSAPFSDESYDRISGTTYPAWQVISGQGSEYADIIPLVISAAKTAGTVVSQDIDIADLLSTLGGSFAFDAMMLGGTTALNAAGKAMSRGGKVAKGTGLVARAAAIVPGIVGKAKLPHAAKGLTIAELNRKISSALG